MQTTNKTNEVGKIDIVFLAGLILQTNAFQSTVRTCNQKTDED